MRTAPRAKISVALGIAAVVCIVSAGLYSVDDWPGAHRSLFLFSGLALVLLILAAKISPGRGLRAPTPIDDPEKTVVLTSDRVGSHVSQCQEDSKPGSE